MLSGPENRIDYDSSNEEAYVPRYVIESLVVIGIGLMGLVASIKSWFDMRAYGSRMVGGGEIYVATISLVLIACGTLYVISRRRSLDEETAIKLLGSGRGAMLCLLLFAYATVIPMTGYIVGSLCFFPLAFYMAGLRGWPKSILTGVITAILFYLLFFLLIKLPLP